MANAGLDSYACDCGWLEEVANNPSVPIGFDARVNEYYLRAGTPEAGEARYVIRFCPSCGGDAPVSHRASLFEVITPQETARLHSLWTGLKTREDVIRAWGKPDNEIANGYAETEPNQDGSPGRTIHYEVMRYNNLSSTAVVDVILGVGDRVRFSLWTKQKST